MTMTRHIELEAIADLLRRHAPRWTHIDSASDRPAVSGRAHNWTSRPPRAFASGGFEFRTRKEHDGRGGIKLEGRYVDDTTRPPIHD